MSSLQSTNPENTDPDLKFDDSVASHFNTDKVKLLDEMSEKYNTIKRERIKEYNSRMRSELARIQTFVGYPTFSACTPEEMAAAGFYYFNKDIYVQCFCCGLVMCSQSLKKSTFALHKEREPNCHFMQGIDVGNIPKYNVRVRKPVEVTQEAAERYQKKDSRLESFQNWPFYTQAKPSELAAAGFFYTGLKDDVQCFSCGGSLGDWEVDDDPWKEHCKWFPECEYLHSVKTEQEIKQYAKNYVGFTGVTRLEAKQEFEVGTHAVADDDDDETQIPESQSDDTVSLFVSILGGSPTAVQAEGSNDSTMAASLEECNTFGMRFQDSVQCFTCGGQVYKWEVEDDPWIEHAKHLPQCHFVLQKNAKEQTEVTGDEVSKRQVSQPSVNEKSGVFHQSPFMKETREMELQLKGFYRSPAFSKMFPFGDAVHLPVDLCHTFADLHIVLKNIKDQPVSRVFLPDMLRDLHHITVIEGEAGSGKSSLLRRIAILWASGCCPVLSRFKLVFYIPLSSVEKHNDISGISITGCQTSVKVPGHHLRDMANLYGNRLLFLLDDYGDGPAVPAFLEEIIRKNPVNRVVMLIGIRTNKASMLRQIARVFSIQEFPLYSSFYLLKMVFSHDVMKKESFIHDLCKFPAQLTILKTPLFTFAICVLWVHYPLQNSFSPYDIFKTFLQYITHRHSSRDSSCLVSVCGSLALKGIFESQSNFTAENIRELELDEGKLLQLGLLTKFTAQRLHPVYRFYHHYFQTFLAGKKMIQLLESDIPNERGQGMQYLKKIDTIVKVLSDFRELLLSAMTCSSSSALQIITHLFQILQSDSLIGRDTESWDIFHHQEVIQQLFETTKKGFVTVDNANLRIHMAQIFLDFIIQLAIKGQCLEKCYPEIVLYLRGKQLQFSTSSNEKWQLLEVLKNHPECLPLLEGISLILIGKNAFMKLGSHLLQRYVDRQGPPTVESEYESTVQCYTTQTKEAEMESTLHTLNRHYEVIKSYIPKDVTEALYPAAGKFQVPLLQLNVYGLNGLDEDDCDNLAAICSTAKCLHLKLIRSPFFLNSIIPVLFYYKDLLLSCTIEQTELDTKEQFLLTCCTRLESLHIKADDLQQVPGMDCKLIT
ncbi:baculoviral IAP repeat-containing protein 1-like [Protopterus annectens]|uniref:baculoviral IAP repeat-containing protein 1-like n=1 Tax=Protopterus annectens TaxID=7888 RepID=UPI001CFB9EAC|nr:baculoviral IAP repeat-containing protein 1-like [Protopterus annectens]